MNKDLLDARRAASRGATVGGTVLYVVTALAIACELLRGLMLLGPKLPGTWGDPVFNALLATSQVIAIITMALLGRFLRHFATDAAPFRTAEFDIMSGPQGLWPFQRCQACSRCRPPSASLRSAPSWRAFRWWFDMEMRLRKILTPLFRLI